MSSTSASASATTETVSIDEPERMNLLGLMLADIIDRNARTAAGARALQRLCGDVVVGSGPMVVTLSFGDGRLVIARGARPSPAAQVRGGLETLLQMALSGKLVTPVLSGRLRVRGNPLLLLRMRPLLRV